MGVRRSALRSNLENALRFSGSSIGRRTRCASARAARRTNELRVSPALRAAASMSRRSVSGSETSTLRMPIVYPMDIRGWGRQASVLLWSTRAAPEVLGGKPALVSRAKLAGAAFLRELAHAVDVSGERVRQRPRPRDSAERAHHEARRNGGR